MANPIVPMTREELLKLLEYGEDTWLDWKADFPPALVQQGAQDQRERARAVLLKDLVALANSDVDRTSFLVYGVKDLGTERRVTGVSIELDDADVQTWVENTFEPTFEFSTVRQHLPGSSSNDVPVELFCVPAGQDGPFVVKRSTGGVLYEGQVWLRHGSRNSIAKRSELEEMFRQSEPYHIPKMDDPQLERIIEHYKGQGYEAVLPRLESKDVKLSEGYEVATHPETGREVWVGSHGGRWDHILMLKPRETQG